MPFINNARQLLDKVDLDNWESSDDKISKVKRWLVFGGITDLDE